MIYDRFIFILNLLKLHNSKNIKIICFLYGSATIALCFYLVMFAGKKIFTSN